MRERDIETRLVGRCKTIKVTAFKFVSPAKWAVPDRLLVGPKGFHMFVEVKAPGRKPTSAQEREIARLRDKGHWVEIIDSYEGVELLIEQILEVLGGVDEIST